MDDQMTYAVAWSMANGGRYRFSAKSFGVNRKALMEAVKAEGGLPRGPAPARPREEPEKPWNGDGVLLGTNRRTPADEDGEPAIDDDGVPWAESPIDFLEYQLANLDRAGKNAIHTRDIVSATKLSTEVYLKLQSAKAQAAGDEELEEVEQMFDVMLLAFEQGVSLLTPFQRKRLAEVAALNARLADV